MKNAIWKGTNNVCFVLWFLTEKRGFFSRLKKEDFFFPTTQNMETNSNNSSELEGINQVNT